MSRSLSYYPALDGVRGWAVLAVMVHHAREASLSGGFMGVDLFFVLSGFLITTILVREQESAGRVSLFRFYARRFLRLGPALMLVISSVVLAGPALFGIERAALVKESGIVLFYMSNWARAFQWHSFNLLPHTWSLSIEEQFYILWPAFFLSLSRVFKGQYVRAFALAAAGALLSAAWRFWMISTGVAVERIYSGLDTRADGLLIGCAAAYLRASGFFQKEGRLRLLSWASAPALAWIVYICFTAHWRNPDLYRWQILATHIATAALLFELTLRPESWLCRFFSWRPIVWTGVVSYGLYLWHYPLFQLMLRRGLSETEILRWGIPASFAVAAVSFYAFEKPILNLKDRFAAAGPGPAANRA